MRRNDDGEHKIARGMALKQTADAWSHLIGVIGILAAVFIGIGTRNLLLGFFIFIVSLWASAKVYKSILNGKR